MGRKGGQIGHLVIGTLIWLWILANSKKSFHMTWFTNQKVLRPSKNFGVQDNENANQNVNVFRASSGYKSCIFLKLSLLNMINVCYESLIIVNLSHISFLADIFLIEYKFFLSENCLLLNSDVIKNNRKSDIISET